MTNKAWKAGNQSLLLNGLSGGAAADSHRAMAAKPPFGREKNVLFLFCEGCE